MQQAKFSVKETQAHFLNNFKAYGFKDKSSLIRTANDNLKELTKTALSGWPEWQYGVQKKSNKNQC